VNLDAITRRGLMAAAVLAIASSGTARTQPAERVRRIGYLTAATGSPDDEPGVQQTRALVAGLRELGWVDGRNVIIEHRFSGAGRERMRANAKELVALKPDVIVSFGGRQLEALLAETRTIPIVFTMVSDPVASGFVASLAQPGGNATGVGVNEAPLAGKWLELLKEIAPEMTRAMVFTLAETRSQQLLVDAVAAAAASLGLPLVVAAVGEAADFDREMAAFAREPGGGVVALSSPLMGVYHQRVHALAVRYRLPVVYNYPIYARSGGLLSYGPDQLPLVQEVARYVDKILRGAKPGDLPVQQPTRFELVVNLKTAQALGLTVPASILARADEVIE
jgi:putative tryptophan/tyrosine transport system substrate-binding protein